MSNSLYLVMLPTLIKICIAICKQTREHTHTHTHTHKFNARVIIVENGIGDPSSNLDNAVCILLCVNAIRKGMNPSLLSFPNIYG